MSFQNVTSKLITTPATRNCNTHLSRIKFRSRCYSILQRSFLQISKYYYRATILWNLAHIPFFIKYIMIEMFWFIKILVFKAWMPLLVMWRSADLSSQVAITLLLLLLPTKMKLDLKHPIIGYGKHNPVFQNDETGWCVEKSIDILACW